MNVNKQAVLEMCIDAGLSSTVYGCDIELTTAQMQRIIDKAQREIWLQIDTYFDFE